MRHRNRSRKIRRLAPAAALFEQALLGSSDSDAHQSQPHSDRKTLQLCRQVERALGLALAGECGDPLLRELHVVEVKPMGGASQLLVCVAAPLGMSEPVFEVLARLNERAGKLRAAVAASISRKRTPSLSFVLVPAEAFLGGGSDENN